MGLDFVAKHIKGWEGAPIQTLGNVLHSGFVDTLGIDLIRRRRFLIAFPDTIVVLKVDMGSFHAFEYVGKLPMSGLIVRKMRPAEGHPFAFEMSSDLIQPLVVICFSEGILNQWLQAFCNNVIWNLARSFSNITLPDSTPLNSSQMQTSASSDSSLEDPPTTQKNEAVLPEPYHSSTSQEILRQMACSRRRNVRLPMSDPSSTNQPSPNARSVLLQDIKEVLGIQTAPNQN